MVNEERKNMLNNFVNECKKIDGRISIAFADEKINVRIGEREIRIDGYNYPYQVYLITSFMHAEGSFA